VIKVNRGQVEIVGIEPEVRAEFSVLVRTLYENELLTTEQIKEDVEMGLMNDMDLNKRLKERMDKLFEIIKR
jgi:hypothetical protein